MYKISEVVVVEGKYDKLRLSQVIDAVIITTDGFRLYKDKEKLSLIKKLAQKHGVIVLTDSDNAGFRIRNYIKQCMGDVKIKHAYIPEIKGKERRKSKSGAEGLLGVEGIPDEVILDVIKKANATQVKNPLQLTKADLFELGLCGRAESANKRKIIAEKLGLPSKISANALLDALNLWCSREEFFNLIEED
jgi:ribonuclease M5